MIESPKFQILNSPKSFESSLAYILKERMYNHISGVVKRRINNCSVHSLVTVLLEGVIIGYAMKSKSSSDSWEAHVWIKPNHRSKGFGSKALDQLFSQGFEAKTDLLVYGMSSHANRMYKRAKEAHQELSIKII
jgi:ribosomal protein S18 acetylase RimI-like enzyme